MINSSRTELIPNRTECKASQSDEGKTSLSRAWFCIPVLAPQLDSMRGSRASECSLMFKNSGKERVPFLKDL